MDAFMKRKFISDQSHVAQQSRREKLRVQHQHRSPSRAGGDRVDDYTSSLEVVQPVFSRDLNQVGDNEINADVNLMYHPTRISSEQACSFAGNSTNLVLSGVDGSLRPRRENYMENCGVWKSVGGSRENASVGVATDLSAFEMRAKLSTTGQLQSQFQYGEVSFDPQSDYRNALSDEVTTAVAELQSVGGSTCDYWGSYGGNHEHVRIVPYGGYQLDGEPLPNGSTWNGEMSSLHSRIDQMVVDSHSQGLSLSLCSNPATTMVAGSQYGDARIPQSIPLRTIANISYEENAKAVGRTNFIRTANVGQGDSLQDQVGPSSSYHRQSGPLGPFTGYATILKSSKFLKPAQQLLNEYCGVIGMLASSSTLAVSERNTGETGELATAGISIESEVESTNAGDTSGLSRSAHQDSHEIINGATSSLGPGESHRPDYQLKKAKLLYMLDEVTRRYRQYYHQMQMVVSAFESVAGLAAATPYVSSALKTVSRHFNHLKHAISDQLWRIKTFLGENFSSPPSGIRNNKGGDLNAKRLKLNEHYCFQRHSYGGSNMGLLEPQQHIWRPQRGLPERAVSVLKAWLFEHFLHPYPTDTDKHLLATQTGLTRSQVSNWFINARVRLWKPMVEEIHMLETKGLAERDSNAVKDDNRSANVDEPHPKADQSLHKMAENSMACVSLECSGMDEGMTSISRYHQTAHGHEISGIGSVSLTLGLRQSAGNHQQQSVYFHQQQDRMRRHLEGHTVHEYAG
uniref:Homeobox domain-containing protein n=1 Tax=Kalanchoe fedtschenkoi TaxID=63787 RepID=A0A7N0VC40_KALFE